MKGTKYVSLAANGVWEKVHGGNSGGWWDLIPKCVCLSKPKQKLKRLNFITCKWYLQKTEKYILLYNFACLLKHIKDLPSQVQMLEIQV